MEEYVDCVINFWNSIYTFLKCERSLRIEINLPLSRKLYAKRRKIDLALRPFSYANRREVAIFTLDSIGPSRKVLLRR